MADSPAFTVLMPTYNAGPFLRPAVESILQQSFRNFEFLIIEDASTDGSAEVLHEYAGGDSRIRVVNNKINLGVTRSLNRGLSLARAPWIARMDADDISKPERLARQWQEIRRNPTASFITSTFETIDAGGRVVERPHMGIYFKQDLLPWYLLFYNRVGGHGQVCYSAEMMGKVGGYDESTVRGQDYELWPRLLRQAPCAVIREPLYQWRRDNPNSVSRTRRDDTSTRVAIREIAAMCGVDVTPEEATAFRHFWQRTCQETFDCAAIQRRLLDLANRFRPSRPVPNLQRRLRCTVAQGWLANALRAWHSGNFRRAVTHVALSREAAGKYWPRAVAEFSYELCMVAKAARSRLRAK